MKRFVVADDGAISDFVLNFHAIIAIVAADNRALHAGLKMNAGRLEANALVGIRVPGHVRHRICCKRAVLNLNLAGFNQNGSFVCLIIV